MRTAAIGLGDLREGLGAFGPEAMELQGSGLSGGKSTNTPIYPLRT